MKKLIALLLAAMMMVAGISTASAMTAGTYTASAKGFGGDVTVTVEVSDSAILSVAAEAPVKPPVSAPTRWTCFPPQSSKSRP